MSDYDQQLADQVQTEFELDEVFKDLEDGVLLTERQIDLLRHCCGTKIKFTDEFESQNWVLKADILKDAISDLTDKYDQILKDKK